METRLADCPLGAKCEEVKLVEGRQVLFRCPWYLSIRGVNPNTGENMDEWRCAIAWLPILSINTTAAVRSGAAATESFRNDFVKIQGVSKEKSPSEDESNLQIPSNW